MTMDEFMEGGRGYLQVQVTSANGAIPEEGALVLIYSYPEEGSKDSSELIAAEKTDISGNTRVLTLPAPPKSLSLSPSSPGAPKPYAAYNIEVSKDGFYSVEGVGAPVFDGMTSIQKINLIPSDPFSQYPDTGLTIIESPAYSQLEGKSGGDGT